ncbi:MAG: bifunctional riboflavin kinase/FAD synthetase [Rhodothermales bacterium]
MITFRHTVEADLKSGCIVTMGSFDGLHLGHQTLLEATRKEAERRGLPAVMVTFDPHPREVLTGRRASLLTTVAERSRLARQFGMDGVSVLAFTSDVAALDPDVFVRRVLLDGLNMKGTVVGHDHHFGRGRTGNVVVLRELSADLGFEVTALPALTTDGQVISSSRIRVALGMGDVHDANDLLGYAYGLTGTVVHGAGRGRTIGFPTANLQSEDERKVVPDRGVYAVHVYLDDGSVHDGMMNIGYRPTFGGTGMHLEVNILDWSGDLYGREVRVEYAQRIRSERKFDGIEALVAQLNEDRERCRAALR